LWHIDFILYSEDVETQPFLHSPAREKLYTLDTPEISDHDFLQQG